VSIRLTCILGNGRRHLHGMLRYAGDNIFGSVSAITNLMA
jgi:hypothetical protein